MILSPIKALAPSRLGNFESNVVLNNTPADVLQLQIFFRELLVRADTKELALKLLQGLEAIHEGITASDVIERFGQRLTNYLRSGILALADVIQQTAEELDEIIGGACGLLTNFAKVSEGDTEVFKIGNYSISQSTIKQFLTGFNNIPKNYYSPKTPTELIPTRFQDINSYPRDSRDMQYIPEASSLYAISKDYLYTIFIDRENLEYDYEGRKYSSTMFDDDLFDTPTGDYISACCNAYLSLESISQENLSFDNLIKCMQILLGEHNSDNVFPPRKAACPLMGICRFYIDPCPEPKAMDMLLNYYNNKINQTLLHHYMQITPFLVATTFTTVEERVSVYKQFHELYLQNISQAKGIRDQANRENSILSSILFFISQLQVSHLFKNGNNRLCVQVLLNKLLCENGFGPTALYIPNGITEFSISLLTKYMHDHGIADIPNLYGITQALMPAIEYIKEGQKFLKQSITEFSTAFVSPTIAGSSAIT